MIAFELLVRAAIGAGVSVPFQNDAADDLPVVCRKPPPVKGTYVLKDFSNSGLRAAQQRQY